jgi:hypothetical protein
MVPMEPIPAFASLPIQAIFVFAVVDRQVFRPIVLASTLVRARITTHVDLLSVLSEMDGREYNVAMGLPVRSVTAMY